MWLEEFGDVDTLAFYIFCAAAAVLAVLFIILIFLPCCVPSTRGMSPGTSMDFYIAIGGRLLAFVVLVKGISPEWVTVEQMQILCEMYPCALLLGLTMFIGGIVVKATSISAFQWVKSPYPQGSEWKPNLGMWVLILIMGIVAIVWSVVNTPELSEITSMRFACESINEFQWQVATSAWHGVLLFLAIVLMPVQCKRSRQTPASPESTALSVVTINITFVVVAATCVWFLLDGTPTMHYAINSGLTMWMVLFTDLLLLTGRVISARTYLSPDYADDRYDTIKADEEYSVIPYGGKWDSKRLTHTTNQAFKM